MKIQITNTPADWIEVDTDTIQFIKIKAVGYPNYTVTHLTKDNVKQLVEFLQDLLSHE